MKYINFLIRLLNFFPRKLKYLELKSKATFNSTFKYFKTTSFENSQNDKSKIKIGNNTVIRGELFIFGHGGEIEIGDFCFIGENSKIWSAEKIVVGNRVLISHNVNIHDTNGHPINVAERAEHFKEIIFKNHPANVANLNSKAIKICDDAWIGFNSIILKGITIGEGAVVAAGSLVTKDVEAFTMVAGNPAKFIKKV